MTSGKDDEEFFKQRGFGIKMGFGERPALIIIDMLKGFTDAEMPLGANLDKSSRRRSRCSTSPMSATSR